MSVIKFFLSNTQFSVVFILQTSDFSSQLSSKLGKNENNTDLRYISEISVIFIFA